MNMDLLVNLSYVAAAVLFIFGLKMLGSPATARKGNLVSAVGMFIAVVVTLLDQSIIDYKWIAVGIAVGGIIGAVVARSVAMTSMPEMVALFNGFGGIASLLVGWAALYGMDASTFQMITIVLSILIGGITPQVGHFVDRYPTPAGIVGAILLALLPPVAATLLTRVGGRTTPG